jgi:hypothetical protein
VKPPPYVESLRATLTRTIAIAAVAAVIVSTWSGGLRRWPILFMIMMWPAFGGHWIDLFFLNWLRQRLPPATTVQRVARLTLWFGGGIVLAIGARMTATRLMGGPPARWPTWEIAGAGFVAIELIAHAVLHLRGRPSFYDGKG